MVVTWTPGQRWLLLGPLDKDGWYLDLWTKMVVTWTPGQRWLLLGPLDKDGCNLDPWTKIVVTWTPEQNCEKVKIPGLGVGMSCKADICREMMMGFH